MKRGDIVWVSEFWKSRGVARAKIIRTKKLRKIVLSYLVEFDNGERLFADVGVFTTREEAIKFAKYWQSCLPLHDPRPEAVALRAMKFDEEETNDTRTTERL